MKPTPLLLALAFASGAAVAGMAEVRFVDPSRFTDLATSGVQEAETMNALASHIQQLATRLPADQVLRVEVLDVDLAGDARPTRRGNVRVNDGRADPPVIRLRYTLEAGGQAVKRGEERLVDLAYQRPGDQWRSQGQFHYERRLLTEWFARSFGEPHAAR